MKRSHIEATSKDNVDDEDDGGCFVNGTLRHQGLHPSLSVKVDESPEIVRHLVQTLGLIGGDSQDLDKVGKTGSISAQGERERHNSLV